MQSARTLRLAAILLAWTVLGGTGLTADALGFPEAMARLHKHNESLQAARVFETQRERQRQAARGLYFPRLDINSRFTHLGDPLALDLSAVRQGIGGLFPDVPPESLPPASLHVLGQDYWRGDVELSWPVFTGGRITAANRAAEAEVRDAREARRETEDELVSELVRRYYGLRLASRNQAVREEILKNLDRHFYDARRLEEEGLIAKAERLSAETARAEAARDLDAALEDVGLARTALANTLASDESIEATSPLFLNDRIEALEVFKAKAAEHSPALGRLAAARDLAREGVRAQKADFFPTVYVFGRQEWLKRSLTQLDPERAVGVSATFTLFDGVGRTRRLAAARARQERVDLLDQKARRDVATLVEQHYRELTKARTQFRALDTTLALARENLRVRLLAFQEDQATSIQVIDAQTSLAAVELARLAAAYDYLTALAGLLEAIGQSDRFDDYRVRADVRVED